MTQVLFIVWRESLEALLVVSVLQAWISRQPDRHALHRGLRAGIAAGIALSLAAAFAALGVPGLLGDGALDVFQPCMAALACILIVQMLRWMRRHAETLRHVLSERAHRAPGRWGLASVVALAIAREGAETAIFLLGLGSTATASRALTAMAALGGLALAVLTSWLVARYARLLPMRLVFRGTEIVLLCVAAGMLSHAVDGFIALEWLPPGADPILDLSAILPDHTGIGRALSDLVGYRARPSAALLVAMLAFWVGSPALLARSRRRQ